MVPKQEDVSTSRSCCKALLTNRHTDRQKPNALRHPRGIEDYQGLADWIQADFKAPAAQGTGSNIRQPFKENTTMKANITDLRSTLLAHH